jgi:hypothetical protein
MSATVEIHLIGVDLAETMRQMRMWLDHHKVVPNVFRQSACPGGLALHVEFRLPNDAAAFALRFTGRVLGDLPDSFGIAPAALRGD